MHKKPNKTLEKEQKPTSVGGDIYICLHKVTEDSANYYQAPRLGCQS